ncbi:predicted protein [Streptomyces sp. SPB78]|nr:predicted protein [Streptomyces sp. SPB78]
MTTCARPTCAFTAVPQLNEAGTLSFGAFCSEECRGWGETDALLRNPMLRPFLTGVVGALFPSETETVLGNAVEVGLSAARANLAETGAVLDARPEPVSGGAR